MKLVSWYWNGNKNGMTGEYPDRQAQRWLNAAGDPMKVDDTTFLYRPHDTRDAKSLSARQQDYLGHNICAIAVDGDGDIIDFEFNHNNVFSSSVEHAESRLVRRIFSLALLDEGWNLVKPDPNQQPQKLTHPATYLSNVTIYTSLESCAQCTGIMALAGIQEVVYLQKDYGTYAVGNILYNLSNGPMQSVAPKPVSGDDFSFEYYDELNNAYRNFYKDAGVVDTQNNPTNPFYRDGKTPPKVDQAVTSFLCIDDAYNIFKKASDGFDGFAPAFPDFKSDAADAVKNPNLRTNQSVFEDAKRFFETASVASRGTPHRL